MESFGSEAEGIAQELEGNADPQVKALRGILLALLSINDVLVEATVEGWEKALKVVIKDVPK